MGKVVVIAEVGSSGYGIHGQSTICFLTQLDARLAQFIVLLDVHVCPTNTATGI